MEEKVNVSLFNTNSFFLQKFSYNVIGWALFTAFRVANHIWPSGNNFWLYGRLSFFTADMFVA
jgi:hypothetical protein